jgi:hypothetical protein
MSDNEFSYSLSPLGTLKLAMSQACTRGVWGKTHTPSKQGFILTNFVSQLSIHNTS